MVKDKLSKKNWFIITLFCFMGGIAWNTENMYFNAFITNEIYADVSQAAILGSMEATTAVARMVALSAIAAVVTTFIMGALSDKVKNRKMFISVGYILWGIVTAMMLKSEAVSHDLLGEEYTDNAEKLREILDRYNGTVFEGFTGDEVLSGLDPTRGTECCAVVEQMYSYEEMFAHTGDNKWAERLEVLGFNALPATLSEDMWTHQYVQQVNQITCQKTMIMAPWSTNGPYAHTFGLEPNFGCCTANFNQGWPKFALSAFMHNGNTIINALMLPSVLNDNGVTIKLETNYPFENKMHYYIDAQKDFNFVIRIPSFAKNLKANGENTEVKDIEFAINIGKTEIEIEFSATPFLKARPNNLYALQMGSLLFSVPIEYEKQMREYVKKGVERKFPYCDYQFIPKTPWNYGFVGDDFETNYHTSCDIPFSQNNPPITIKAKIQQIGWGLKFPYRSIARKTPKSINPISDIQEIKLCPYGCAKLRMTEMPIIGKK